MKLNNKRTDAPTKLDAATISLIDWAHRTSNDLVKPDLAKEAPGSLETMQYVWTLIVNKVGYYKDRSFALNAKGQEMYRTVEHNMKILNLMYGEDGV